MSEEQLNSQENQPQAQQQQNQQNPFPPQNGGFGNGMPQSLPNATLVLVLGILSIVTCCCYGIIGIILAIIALVLSKKDKFIYESNPNSYTESSYKNLKAGRICAIIGLILSILDLLLYVGIIAIFGFAALKDPELMKEILQNMQ